MDSFFNRVPLLPGPHKNGISFPGTFKLKKSKLQEEGFDPAKVADPVYVSDPRQGRYVRLTAELLEELNSGKLRL